MTENWCLGGTGWFILWDIMVFDQQCSVVLHCGLVECVCSVAISVLCVKLRAQATPD